jgi:hypothetical protein
LECQSEIEVERFSVWWPHSARKKKAEDRHAKKALAQDTRGHNILTSIVGLQAAQTINR